MVDRYVCVDLEVSKPECDDSPLSWVDWVVIGLGVVGIAGMLVGLWLLEQAVVL